MGLFIVKSCTAGHIARAKKTLVSLPTNWHGSAWRHFCNLEKQWVFCSCDSALAWNNCRNCLPNILPGMNSWAVSEFAFMCVEGSLNRSQVNGSCLDITLNLTVSSFHFGFFLLFCYCSVPLSVCWPGFRLTWHTDGSFSFLAVVVWDCCQD